MERNFKELVLGCLYRDGNGNIVYIIEFLPMTPHGPLYRGLNNYHYHKNGDCFLTRAQRVLTRTPKDLVERISQLDLGPTSPNPTPKPTPTKSTSPIAIQFEDGYTMIVESISDIPKQTKFKLVENFNV